MKKILFVYFIFLLCFTSKAEASNTADKRIMGKNTNPHVVFQCHDVNDPKPYLLGFTPVFHSNDNESYYVVTYFRMQNGDYLPDAAESLMFVSDEFHGGKNVWYEIAKSESKNFIGISYRYLGEGFNLHRSNQEYQTRGNIMIRPIKNNEIPESAKQTLDKKKVDELILNLKTLDLNIKKLSKAYNDDPNNHLNNIVKESKALFSNFMKLYEIYELGVTEPLSGDHSTNKDLCKKVNF